MRFVLPALAAFFSLATLIPLIRHDQWWIRIFDFPRLHIACGAALVLIAYVIFLARTSGFGWGHYLAVGVLSLSFLYQAYRIFPYTPVAGEQSLVAADPDQGASVSLLIANVLISNRNVEGLLEVVQQYDPDLILTVETDDWWAEQLAALKETHPHTIEHPLDNTYGMLLHSRLELIQPELKYLVKDSIPSVHAWVRLPGGQAVRLYGLHPEPPYPKWAKQTTERDAELLVVGKAIEERDEPAIVAGDLNDVAWSYTTHLFQEISETLDPRVGRGLYNTFSAKNPVLKWPLDHVFHTSHFKLVRLERGPKWGSDHFPVYIELALDPDAQWEQQPPQADAEDEKTADEKIEKAQELQEEGTREDEP